MAGSANGERRPGAQTRAEILRVARELFTEKGFEGTSTRDISAALGITKSSLYYHFKNKDEIAASLTEQRIRDVDELLEWVAAQSPGPDLLRQTVLRWIDTTTEDSLVGMRLAHANQPMLRRLAGRGTDVRTAIDRVIEKFYDEDTSTRDRLMIRMAFNAVAFALLSAPGSDAGPEDIVAVARQAAVALTEACAARP
jgi:AcrR family transcriptional regulator